MFLGGEKNLAEARGYAARVREVLDNEKETTYWSKATEAEVALILGEYPDAARLYEESVALARKDTGSHRSTRDQARLLMEHLEMGEEERALIEAPFAHVGDD